ncbi:hypothetical protein CCO02nite_26670 [Cellulomonas composti]|uniref:Arc-like DNA binding domain-containing protein n=1 Tax=Cellulomonas composti TaxID=266130 RepID=A0A511JDZ5_9CELL|nr:hypothetical protein CCO02nite_26670 [Cellulomonas composti]
MTEQPTNDPALARRERRSLLLRLDPSIHDALARWAADDLRSVNAQIDLLLRRALLEAGRLPADAAPSPRRGRPPRSVEPRSVETERHEPGTGDQRVPDEHGDVHERVRDDERHDAP